MTKRATRSINSSWLLAAAISICPAVAGAQTWNPTASDSNFNTAAGGLALPNHAGTEGPTAGRAGLTLF